MKYWLTETEFNKMQQDYLDLGLRLATLRGKFEQLEIENERLRMGKEEWEVLTTLSKSAGAVGVEAAMMPEIPEGGWQLCGTEVIWSNTFVFFWKRRKK